MQKIYDFSVFEIRLRNMFEHCADDDGRESLRHRNRESVFALCSTNITQLSASRSRDV